MKAGMKINKILAATVLALAAPSAFAQTISASNTNATINTAFPPGHVVTVTVDRQGQTVNGFLFELEYNTAHLSLGAQHTDPNVAHPRVTIAPGSTGGADFGCVELVVGTLRCATGATITSATFAVNIAFGVLGTAVPNPGSPLTFDQTQTNFVNAAFADTPFSAVNNGSVIIAAAPPPTPPILTFAPASGTVVSGSNITITPSGGQAGGTATYTCTPPAGVTVTNNNGNIATGGAQVTMNVTCPAGTADAAMQCTHTGSAGSTVSPVNYNIDCPAAAAPVLNANPASTTPLACNGAAGTTQTASVTFSNSGNANVTGLACNVAGAGFVIGTAPSATIAPAASTQVVVNCTVPAEGAPAATGTLTCNTTAPGGAALTYPLSSQAQNQGGLTQATIVPASSLWSKVGLIGLLAVLGMMVVGFRRK